MWRKAVNREMGFGVFGFWSPNFLGTRFSILDADEKLSLKALPIIPRQLVPVLSEFVWQAEV